MEDGGWKATCAIFYLLSSIFVHADLTATVSPGYTFASGERADTSKLNRLGNPTITITGTLSGTNAGISAGSINANMFAASVVDNVSIDYTNSSPQAIRIKSAGVGVRELSTAVAGSGLAGGSGSVLSVTVDDAGIAITNDVLTLKTNLSVSYLGVASNSVVIGSSTNRGVAVGVDVFSRMLATNAFSLGGVSLSTGRPIDTAHGLGVKPTMVRAVFVMGSSTELGYSEGDEVDVGHCNNNTGGVVYSVGASASNVWVSGSIASGVFIAHKTTGATTGITTGNWSLKIYARP